jgi:hypothetical protein
MASHHILRLLALSFLVFAAGCYDSRWGTREKLQREHAAKLAPANLATHEGTAKVATRTLRLRALATARFTGQTLDWQHDVRDVVSAASDVLVEATGARLELVSIETWTTPGPEDDLDVVLQSLAQRDAGDGVDVLIGLVGGLPKFTTSFHDLGRGEILGRHVVIRAATDLAEHDVVDVSLDELSLSERLDLVAERRRHRAIAVLLHELAHTLGAVHETSAGSVMQPTYSPKTSGFGPGASALLLASIAHRADPNTVDATRAMANDLLAVYEGPTSASWVAPERASIIARLKSFLTPPVPTTAPSTSTSAGSGIGPRPFADVAPQLLEADRPIYARLVERWNEGNFVDAWKLGEPLFARYTDLLPIQDLRCQLAMRLGFSWERTKTECARLMTLQTGKPAD